MPSQLYSSRPCRLVAAAGSAAAIAILSTGILPASAGPIDMSILDREQTTAAIWTGPVEYYLDVFINDLPMRSVVAVEIDAGERFTMKPKELEKAGILAQKPALDRDGNVDLSRLSGVTFAYDEAAQSITFYTTNEYRTAQRITARGRFDPGDETDPRNSVQYGTGGVFNYSVAAHTGYEYKASEFYDPAISGIFAGRLYSKFGTVENSFTYSQEEFRRLDSYWTWSDPRTMTTLRAGDMITGGLSWSRPARLAGFQVQRNFGLRPGLITMPVPGFNGSAAVPSTVEVFLDNARRFTRDVAPGPFEVTDMPVVSGGGTARIVVRDADGNETVTESDYYVSSRLLQPGLLDYSIEAGVPRTGYGTHLDHYGKDIFGSASMRYGVADWLTLEAHAEGGKGLINGGAGLITTVGRYGLFSASVTGSDSDYGAGYQVNLSAEAELGDIRVNGRIQRAFGDYADIGRVTEAGSGSLSYWDRYATTPKSVDQVSVSTRLPFDRKSSLSLNFTQLETFDSDKSRLFGASYSRPLLGGYFTASGYKDVEKDRYAFYAGFSMPLGDTGIRASTSARSTDHGTTGYASLSRPARYDNGDFGWRMTYEQSDKPRFSAYGDKKTPIAELEGELRQQENGTSASGRVSGSVVAADGSVFLAPRIDDAFAVVDAGVPGVPVRYENRLTTVTGRNGKAILPDLRSWERNQVSIDTKDLPVDVVATHTKETVIPASRNGVVVSFAERGGSAIVIFRDVKGEFVPAGTEGRLNGAKDPFVVGFDGQAFISGLDVSNSVALTYTDGAICRASFGFRPRKGEQTVIDDVECRQ